MCAGSTASSDIDDVDEEELLALARGTQPAPVPGGSDAGMSLHTPLEVAVNMLETVQPYLITQISPYWHVLLNIINRC